jgi:hypothetical protein
MRQFKNFRKVVTLVSLHANVFQLCRGALNALERDYPCDLRSGGLDMTAKALSGLGVGIRELGQPLPPPPRSRARNPRLFGAAAQQVSTTGTLPPLLPLAFSLASFPDVNFTNDFFHSTATE